MKYLLSGAWGYGNIGDDAILEATLPLIRKNDPDAEIVCATYDLKYTSEVGFPLPAVIPSMHRVLSGSEGFWFMSEKDHATEFYSWPRIPHRIYQRFVKPALRTLSISRDKRSHQGGYDRLVEEFKKADVFLMSGGGYFNTWPEQFDARIEELNFAHKYGCKVVLFGQSIGPFTDAQKDVLRKTFLSTDVFCVRDPESVAEINALGFECALAPDLAMGPSHQVPIERGLLTICPAEISRGQERALAKQVKILVSEYGYKVRLMITRWIDPDVATLKRLECLLAEACVKNVEVRYPRTYPDVLKALEGSEWVVSRGLHAMILSWRTGSRVFAITKSRKVDGFLQAINQEENQCFEAEWDMLAKKFRACAIKPFAWDNRLHLEISQAIDNQFATAFKKAGVVA